MPGARFAAWTVASVMTLAWISAPEEGFSFIQTAVLTVGGPALAAWMEGAFSLRRTELEGQNALRVAALEALAGEPDEDDDA